MLNFEFVGFADLELFNLELFQLRILNFEF